jgi:hypothetical protein
MVSNMEVVRLEGCKKTTTQRNYTIGGDVGLPYATLALKFLQA